MSRVRAARDCDKESGVGDQPLQRLLPPARPQQSLGVSRNIPGPRIAADQLAEKGVRAQRYRLWVNQLLKRALDRLTLRDLFVDAVVGELLLDAGWQSDGNWHARIV